MTTTTFNARPGCRTGVGVHNALTAKLAEHGGFDVLWLGSLEISASLGLPDINILSLREMADAIRSVRTGSSLPIFADADNGYGSDTTAIRAVLEFENAGASALCVEDNAFPKRNSLILSGNRPLEARADFARRIGAMARERTTLQIIARTEALVAGLGPQEAIERLESYVSAGADAVFVQANATCADQLPEVVNAASGLAPVVLAPTALPEYGVSDWAGLGVDTVIFANVVVRTLAASVSNTLARLHTAGRLADVSGDLMSLNDLFGVTNTTEWLDKPQAAGQPRHRTPGRSGQRTAP